MEGWKVGRGQKWKGHQGQEDEAKWRTGKHRGGRHSLKERPQEVCRRFTGQVPIAVSSGAIKTDFGPSCSHLGG